MSLIKYVITLPGLYTSHSEIPGKSKFLSPDARTDNSNHR